MVILLDTNLVIEQLRLKGKKSRYIQLISNNLEAEFAISPITIQELFVGQSTKIKKAYNFLTQTLSELTVLPYTEQVAELAGTLTRDMNVPIEFADAAIAATAISYGAELATLNTKDFKNIPELKLLPL